MSDSIAQEAALSGGFRTCKPGDHSFVVLAYGESPFLAGCLDSLRAQTVPSRIVIATSTPSEFIASVAAACGCEVVINPARTDIAGDWNFALTATDARLVTLAHQDDTYDPAFTDRTLKAFADGERVVCFTGYQEIDDAGRSKRSKISVIKHLIDAVILGQRVAVSGFRLRAYLSFGNPLPCSSVTFNTSQLAKFRFSPASNLERDKSDNLAFLID